MTPGHAGALAHPGNPSSSLSFIQYFGLLGGPALGVMLWCLPLGFDATSQKTLAIVACMLVYWMTEPIEHGVTALLGCVGFWAIQGVPFAQAFSGFTSTAPLFIFGALLMGEAAARTGLARRLGYLVVRQIGASYSQVLLAIITLVFLLQFLIPNPNAQLTILAPVVIGLIGAFDVGPHSNVAKGLFTILTYSCTLFSKMVMASSSTVLARGLIETQTGVQILWSQWFLAHLPAALCTVAICWLAVRWLYPADNAILPGGAAYLRTMVATLGPWTSGERKALGWLLLAITLWATDFVHHIDPTVIALGGGLLLCVPRIGLLDVHAIRSVNFLLIFFVAGTLSMSKLFVETQGFQALSSSLIHWLAPWLSEPGSASCVLYWGGFASHFVLGTDNAMVSAGLPVLLNLVQKQGYNPVALGFIWSFAAGGKVFAYQSSVLIFGYSFGYFEAKDVFKIGAVLTVAEGVLLMALVSWYWPLIGLAWR